MRRLWIFFESGPMVWVRLRMKMVWALDERSFIAVQALRFWASPCLRYR